MNDHKRCRTKYSSPNTSILIHELKKHDWSTKGLRAGTPTSTVILKSKPQISREWTCMVGRTGIEGSIGGKQGHSLAESLFSYQCQSSMLANIQSQPSTPGSKQQHHHGCSRQGVDVMRSCSVVFPGCPAMFGSLTTISSTSANKSLNKLAYETFLLAYELNVHYVRLVGY